MTVVGWLQIALVLALVSLALASPAFSQSTILQGGPYADGRAPMYVGAGSGQAASGAAAAFEHDRAGGADLGSAPGGFAQGLRHRLVKRPRHSDLEAAPDASRSLDLLAALSHGANFAMGCYCESEARCHRSVLRELLSERGAAME